MEDLRSTTLPNGRHMFCLQDGDVGLMFGHVESYFNAGISVKKGDVVLDVGANIGMFTTYVSDLCEGEVVIHAFEPIPAIFEILQANCCALDNATIKTHLGGFWSSSQDREFSYYAGAPAMSTTMPESQEELSHFVTNYVDLMLQRGSLPESLDSLKEVPVSVRAQAIGALTRDMFSAQTVKCRVRTLSEFIDDEHLDHIDLLKIDVEKAEWEVLAGLERDDWGKVQQLCAEVHDIDGRLKAIESLLRDKGFKRVLVVEDDEFKGLDIYNVYAWR